MIEVKNLNYSVGSKNILKNITLTIPSNVVTSIIGPNGAGKSSFLKSITSANEGSEGLVLIDSKDISDYSAIELSKKRSVLSQNLEISFPFTVGEIVMMGRSPYILGYETPNDKEIVKDCLKKVSLLSFEDRRFSTLSGGEKQRVHLARVLAQLEDKESREGKYLFLDEPTSALDLKHQSELMKLVKELSEINKITVITILHDINLAAKYSGNVILLKDGSVIASGKPDEALSEDNLKTLYEIDIRMIENNNDKMFFVC